MAGITQKNCGVLFPLYFLQTILDYYFTSSKKPWQSSNYGGLCKGGHE